MNPNLGMGVEAYAVRRRSGEQGMERDVCCNGFVAIGYGGFIIRILSCERVRNMEDD